MNNFDPQVRNNEKELSRARDEQDIISGKRSREQVQKDNAFIRAEFGLKIDFAKAPVAG